MRLRRPTDGATIIFKAVRVRFERNGMALYREQKRRSRIET